MPRPEHHPSAPFVSSLSSPPAVRAATVAALRAAGCVFAEDEAELILGAAHTPDQLVALVRRRAAGLPLEQVLGWAEFRGLRVIMEPGVFVPRARTELLVRQAITRLRPGALVLDLCCGSGAIGLALAAAVPDLELVAADLDPAAVRCARQNLTGPRQRVFAGDLFDPLPAELRGRVDLIAANTPYVPTGEIGLMPRDARDHEPRLALDGGPDGLDLQRRVAAEAPEWLRPGGSLLMEVGTAQVPTGVAVLAGAGLAAEVVRDEDATLLIGTRPG